MQKISKSILLAVLSFLALLVWIFFISPRLPLYRPDFSFKADVSSVDNFYDEVKKKFQGEKTSKTSFTYTVEGEKNNTLLVNNTFHVHTLNGDQIFSVTRKYGINPYTGAHVQGAGDRDRVGYLFAPKHLKKGQSFTYWHINYDGPAHMQFVSEEDFLGLTVYKYETDYKGVTIDQTKELSHLPGVGATRGVRLSPHLTLWVEPVSGRMVKYRDETTAYYYDLKTGQSLHPWNKFSNTITARGVKDLTYSAYAAKTTILIQEIVTPIILFLLGIFFVLKKMLIQKGTWFKETTLLSIVKIIGFITLISGLIAIIGWTIDNPFLIGIVPGFPSMKFPTAFAFILSGINLHLLTKLYDGNEEIARLFLPITTLTLSLLMTTIFISSFLGIRTGIDNLFFQEAQGAMQTIIPGRPSYGTIFSFLLIIAVGIAAILIKPHLPRLLIIAGALIGCIGLAALFGYILNIPALYFYAKDINTGMAIHTAGLFFFYGIGLIILGRIKK